ncbi:MAG: hypothetical protein KAJ55_02935, partial [Anaerolineales bacterium]|nr:hypothetical protein [Anaerolineales bacterium]
RKGERLMQKQKIADGISEAKTLLDGDEGWKVVDKWLERRQVEGMGPVDCTVFLLEKKEEE